VGRAFTHHTSSVFVPGPDVRPPGKILHPHQKSVEILTFAVDVAMCTLTWLVHGIMYPAFKRIGPGYFGAYHSWYTRRITWFVGPLMGMQVILHAFQITRPEAGLAVMLAAVGVLATWVITGIGAVPIHARLSLEGYDVAVVDRLLSVSLWRSLVWTAIVLAWFS